MTNRVRDRLNNGEHAFCVTLDFPLAATAEYLASLGPDALAIDIERGFPDWTRIEDVARACALGGVDLIARLPVDADLISRCLDIGVDGLELTHVESREDVLTMRRCVTFAPEGHRGLGRSRATHFGNYPGGYQKLVTEERRPVIIVHIESKRGVEQLPEILLPEVDIVLPGAYDLSNDLGLAGQVDGQVVQDAVTTIIKSATAAGKVVGMSASTATAVADARRRGARFFLAAESRLLGASLQQLDATVREGGMR